MKKVLFTATVDSHILHFHIPYLKLFKENGYEVHVATNGNEEIPYCDKKHIVSFERSPYKINNLKAIKQLKRIIETEKFDIIHCHTPMGSVVTRLASKKARKKYKTRVIYTAHGFHFYKGAPLLNWILFYPIEKWLTKYTDTLITINNEDYELAKKKFSKRCKDIQYVPGVGIDPNKFNIKMSEKEKNDLRKSLGLKKDDFIMIYPAELSKRKRQIWLINTISDLLKEHEDIHLLLPGKDSLNGECQKLVSKLNLDKQIHLLGYRKDIQKLLRISNISVSAANQEGLPVNIMEAMYVGLPIVASNCRGNRDLLKDGLKENLIELEDSINFKKKIEKLYKKQEVVSKFSKENKEIIKDYLLNKIILKMKKIYFKKKKKKICHVVCGLQSGGAESVIINYCSNMDNEKYEWHILYQHNPIQKSYNEFKKLNFKIKRIPSKKIRPIGNFLQTYFYFKKNDIDVVHSHMTLMNFFPLIAAKLANVQIRISHSHSCNNKNIGFVREKIETLFKKICIKYSVVLVSCGKNAGEYMYKNEEYILLPNAVNIDKYKYNKKNREEIRKKYNIDDDCFLIGHIGNFNITKNHLFMLELIEKLKEFNVKLILVGNGELYEKIVETSKNKKLDNFVIFTGIVEKPEMYYSAFDLFILPSLWEGLPLVSIEAQTNSLNCIISNQVDLSCKINDNVKFLNLNIEDWKKEIIKLLNINSRTKNNKVPYSNYNINKTVKIIEKIYNNEV